MGNVLGGHSKVKVVEDDDGRDLFVVKRPFYSVVPAAFVDALEKALVWFLHRKEKIENYYMLGNYGPVDEVGPERALCVKGELPVSPKVCFFIYFCVCFAS